MVQCIVLQPAEPDVTLSLRAAGVARSPQCGRVGTLRSLTHLVYVTDGHGPATERRRHLMSLCVRQQLSLAFGRGRRAHTGRDAWPHNGCRIAGLATRLQPPLVAVLPRATPHIGLGLSMSFEFNVFVSYARRDELFAKDVASRLDAVGLRVWLDKEQIPAGDEFERAIEHAVSVSQHGIFIVTDDWLRSDYTHFEATTFRRLTRPLTDHPHRGQQLRRVLIPIVHEASDIDDLPAVLVRRNAVVWPRGDPQPDARLWQILCGLTGKAPGPETEWAAQGKAQLRHDASPAPSAPPNEVAARLSTVPPDIVARVSTCGRDWSQFLHYATSSRDLGIVVSGSDLEGHEFFLKSLNERLDPPIRVESVDWHGRVPTTDDGFLAGLAEALKCSPRSLSSSVARILEQQNLLLVHEPVIDDVLQDGRFVVYYRRLLPQLLEHSDAERSLRARGRLKAVQGVAWPAVGRMTSWVADLLSGLGCRELEMVKTLMLRAASSRLVRKQLVRTAHARLPIFAMDELKPITRADVLRWVAAEQIKDPERFVTRAMRGRSSYLILQRMVDQLREMEHTEDEAPGGTRLAS